MCINDLIVNNLSSNFGNISVERLNILFEEAILQNDISFSRGVLGIGWFSSFIYNLKIHKNFDIDESLYELDDLSYKISMNALNDPILFRDEILGCSLYIHQRILNKPTEIESNRRLILHECLRLLMNSYLEILNNKIHHIDLDIVLQYNFLNRTFFEDREGLELFYQKVEEIIDFINKPSRNNMKAIDLQNLFFLMAMAIQAKNSYWIDSIQNTVLNKTYEKRFDQLHRNLNVQFDGTFSLPVNAWLKLLDAYKIDSTNYLRFVSSYKFSFY